MSIAQSLLPEFDHEMELTRKCLALLPESKAAWKPHAKSFSFAELGMHLAEIPGWGGATLQETEFDVNPPGGKAYQRPPFTSAHALLGIFDTNVKSCRAAIAGASDADYLVPWSLKNGGAAMFTMPRIAVVRAFILSHTIHHRAQFGVYLRLNDIPVPAVYGPSADAQA